MWGRFEWGRESERRMPTCRNCGGRCEDVGSQHRGVVGGPWRRRIVCARTSYPSGPSRGSRVHVRRKHGWLVDLDGGSGGGDDARRKASDGWKPRRQSREEERRKPSLQCWVDPGMREQPAASCTAHGRNVGHLSRPTNRCKDRPSAEKAAFATGLYAVTNITMRWYWLMCIWILAT
jgi:hypothetical protein